MKRGPGRILHRHNVRGLLAITAWLAHASCGSTPSSPSSTVALGVWGGDYVSLAVASGGAHAEFDGAHGHVETMLVFDSRGEFSATGTLVREHGGPIRDGEALDAHSAIYEGVVTANTMKRTVRITDLAEMVGPFVLTYGSPGRVVKCL